MFLQRNIQRQKKISDAEYHSTYTIFSPLFHTGIFTDWRVKQQGASLRSLTISTFSRVRCLEDKHFCSGFPLESQNKNSSSHPINASLLKYTTPELWDSGLCKSHFMCEASCREATNTVSIECD